MNFSTVLFDMDGVIVDSETTHCVACQNVFRPRGFELTEEEYKLHFAGRTFRLGFTKYFETIGAEVDIPVLMEEQAKEYMRLSAGNLRTYPGVLEFIRTLARRGTKLGVVTGAIRPEAELTLTTFGIRDLFSTVITADEIQNSKPHPEGYLKGALALDAVPAECIVIEDAPSGVQAAKRAGMRSVAVTNTYRSRELAAATIVCEQLGPELVNELVPIAPLFDICPAFWQVSGRSRELVGV